MYYCVVGNVVWVHFTSLSILLHLSSYHITSLSILLHLNSITTSEFNLYLFYYIWVHITSLSILLHLDSISIYSTTSGFNLYQFYYIWVHITSLSILLHLGSISIYSTTSEFILLLYLFYYIWVHTTTLSFSHIFLCWILELLSFFLLQTNWQQFRHFLDASDLESTPTPMTGGPVPRPGALQPDQNPAQVDQHIHTTPASASPNRTAPQRSSLKQPDVKLLKPLPSTITTPGTTSSPEGSLHTMNPSGSPHTPSPETRRFAAKFLHAKMVNCISSASLLQQLIIFCPSRFRSYAAYPLHLCCSSLSYFALVGVGHMLHILCIFAAAAYHILP